MTAGKTDATAARIAMARQICAKARDTRGTEIEGYLADRGIAINLPPVLRWVPSLRRQDGT